MTDAGSAWIAMLEDCRVFDAAAHRAAWRVDSAALATILAGAGPKHWPRAEALRLELLADIDRLQQPDMWSAAARQAAHIQAVRIMQAGNNLQSNPDAFAVPLNLLSQSFQTVTGIGSDRGIQAAGELLGSFLLDTGDREEAADVLTAAVEAAEQIRLAQHDRGTRLAERRGD